MTSIRESSFSKNMIADPAKLVGMTARRVIVASRPIKNSDIIAPQIIERGQLITLSLKNSVMRLSTQAKALDSGAKGEIIRVVNTTSNKPLQAVILNEGQAQVITY